MEFLIAVYAMGFLVTLYLATKAGTQDGETLESSLWTGVFAGMMWPLVLLFYIYDNTIKGR